MNEIIPIETKRFTGEMVQTVNARDLHEFLEVKSDFRNWIKNRIEDFGFIENQDFVSFAKNLPKPQGGRPSVEYFISLNMAKELSMVERNKKGKQARLYFIECEKVAKTASLALPDFTNPAIAARAWAEEYEKNQKLQSQILLERPKVEFTDKFLASNGKFLVRIVAKAFGMAPSKLWAWLKSHHYVSEKNEAYADPVKRGFLVVHVQNYERDDRLCA